MLWGSSNCDEDTVAVKILNRACRAQGAVSIRVRQHSFPSLRLLYLIEEVEERETVPGSYRAASPAAYAPPAACQAGQAGAEGVVEPLDVRRVDLLARPGLVELFLDLLLAAPQRAPGSFENSDEGTDRAGEKP